MAAMGNNNTMLLSDPFGSYYRGEHEGNPALMYVLNDMGIRFLPRVRDEVWEQCRGDVRILRPLTVKEDNGQTIVIYPEMQGTLESLLKQLSPEYWRLHYVQCALQIARIMDSFATVVGNGLLHRNLSSKTIFVSPNGQLYLGGLFASREYDNVVSANVFDLLATAPEVLSGDRTYDYSCDVYSFGVLLVELETQQIPYTNLVNDYPDIWERFTTYVVNENVRPTLSNGCPEWYCNLVDACLSNDPMNRPEFNKIVEALENQGNQNIDPQ